MGTLVALANASPATAAAALLNIKTTLISGGAVLKGSGSNGTGFDNTGSVDYVDDTTKMGVNHAWFRLRFLDGREWIFQANGSTGLRCKVSESAQFSGGTPSATQTPSATDEVVLGGLGGSDAAPAYKTTFAANGTYTQQIYFDGTTAPYPWYSLAYPIAGGAPTHCLFQDAVDGTEAGEDSPVNFCHAQASGNVLKLADLYKVDAASTGNSVVEGWLYHDVGGSKAFVTIPMLAYVSNNRTVGPNGGVASARTSADPGLPILYYRDGSVAVPQGLKGRSRLMRWPTVPHSTPSAYQAASANDFQLAGDVIMTWRAASGAWS